MTHTSGWRVIFLQVAEKEMDKQPEPIRTKFNRLLEVIREDGFAEIPSNQIKKLRKEIWELRVWGRDTTARTLYLKREGRRVIILRVFTKKDPKTPPSEIKLALQRAKEIENAE